MAFRLRSSKFRHVYGQPHRKENCYENIRITRNAHDSNFCCVNPKYLAVVVESAGGGAFIVQPVEKTGRVAINAPKVCGHASTVLDIKWNPFRDDIIASGSEDSTVKIWQIPQTGLLSNLTEWQVDLHGHGRRVSYIEWHPTADNIILSTGLDYKCIIWNVDQAEPVNVVDCHPDIIYSISWNRDGSLFSTTCKDKTLRIIDPRAGTCVMECPNSFTGIRPMKSVFLGDMERIFCTGFGERGERQVAIFDIRRLDKDLHRRGLDSSNGILIPYYDHDTRMAFIAGKGDGNIQYFEMAKEAPFCHYLNVFTSGSPQRGLGMMPKRGCDTSKCEVTRFYKLHAARNFVEPVSMIVPRKQSTLFHEDVYPPTPSAIPSLTADEWISGQNRDPILISMKDGQVVNDPHTTPSKAVQPQDGVLNQAPTITTYKAVTSQRPPSGSESAPSLREEPKKVPASIQNIKRLSTSDDIIQLAPSKDIPLEGSQPPEKTIVEEKTDKAFVNSKIAAFENKGNIGDNPEADVMSPTRRRFERRSLTSTHDNPPDLIANGMKGGPGEKRSSEAPVSVHNAAQYFEHKEITIIDLQKDSAGDSAHTRLASQISKTPDVLAKSSVGRLILGNVTETNNQNSKVHVKKTWSPVKSPGAPIWDSVDAPNTDPELRKAYFRQVEEIKSLKEQLNLKDKRIRLLEDEVNTLRKGDSTGHGESDC